MRDDGVALQQNSERKTSVSQAPALVDNRTIREINPRDWNRLIDGNALAAHGWLLAAERCWRARWQALYFTLHLEGVLTAAAVCQISEEAPGVETLDDLVLGRLRPGAARVGISLLPALVCGTPQG